ncbi:mechanosensitive ion channel family protein [Candidatus Nanohalovita haloferacivicina]|uniref:mechanosensitive ion channel family protein n=1 Tax=Candidatus Nanohalovita haloferacivicina TaxID=2978046 RepID=UPI00325FA392|nr:Small-conductance mechanosensitive channel [Candidatus Nanohalobia archaeon BNXNv]
MLTVDPSSVLGSGEIALNIVRFLITFAVGAVITKVVVMPLVGRAVSRKADTRTHHSIVNFAGLSGLFISFTIALQAGDFGNLASIIGAIAAALTVAVGFGMRDQVSNIMAGVFLYFDTPFVKGDFIEVNGQSGVVRETNLRDTVIKDESSQKKVIPNAMITGNPTINYTRSDKTRRAFKVDLDPEKIDETEETLAEAAAETSEILEKPEPNTKIDAEEKKAVLHYWIRNPRKAESIESDLSRLYLKKASEKGLLKKEEKE